MQPNFSFCSFLREEIWWPLCSFAYFTHLHVSGLHPAPQGQRATSSKARSITRRYRLPIMLTPQGLGDRVFKIPTQLIAIQMSLLQNIRSVILPIKYAVVLKVFKRLTTLKCWTPQNTISFLVLGCGDAQWYVCLPLFWIFDSVAAKHFVSTWYANARDTPFENANIFVDRTLIQRKGNLNFRTSSATNTWAEAKILTL